MNKILAIFFGISCFVTAYVSNTLLGAGLWFWVILITGVFVSISQYINWLRAAGVTIALLLSIIALLAVVFGALASTIGGGSIDTMTQLLLIFFACISIFGFALFRVHKRLAQELNRESQAESDSDRD